MMGWVNSINRKPYRVWWNTPLIPGLKRQKQFEFEFEASLAYIESIQSN